MTAISPNHTRPISPFQIFAGAALVALCVSAIAIVIVVPRRGTSPEAVARQIEDEGLGQAVVVEMPAEAVNPPPLPPPDDNGPCRKWSPQVVRSNLALLAQDLNTNVFIRFDLQNPIFVRIMEKTVTIAQHIGFQYNVPLYDVITLDSTIVAGFVQRANLPYALGTSAGTGPTALTLIKQLLNDSATIRNQPIGDLNAFLRVPDPCR